MAHTTAAAPKTIFICYRHADSVDHVQRLGEKLEEQLAEHGVYIDFGNEPGENFPERLKRAIATCSVMLVVIGPRWLEITDAAGNRRLDDERDFVRIEIAAGLEREDLVIIPVLVGGAGMPPPERLPEELQPLTRLVASTIRDDRWGDGHRDDDVRALVAVLRRWLAKDKAVVAVGVKAPRGLAGVPRGAWIGAVALLLLLAGAAVLASTRSSDRPTVRIGVIRSLASDGADAAMEARAGVQYAIDYINNSDGPDLGLPLGHGAGLPRIAGGARLAAVDEEIHSSDIRQARCDVRKAVDRLNADGVAAVMGAYESTLTLQAIVAADRDEIPLVTDASSATPLTERDGFAARVRTRCGAEEPDVTPSPWFSRVAPTDRQYSRLFAAFIADERDDRFDRVNVSRVAILHPSKNIIGNAAASDAEAAVSRLEGVAVREFHYDPTTPRRAEDPCTLGFAAELKQRVAQIQAWDAQVVIAVGYTSQAVATVQAMAALGYAPQLLTFGAGFSRANFAELVKRDDPACGLPPADGNAIITRSAFSPRSPGTLAAKAARYFQQTYHLEMTSTAAVSFTAAMTLAQAIDKAGTTDHRKIQSELRGLRISPVETILLGGVSFDDDGQNGDAGAVLLQVQSGSYVPIFPHKLAGSYKRILP